MPGINPYGFGKGEEAIAIQVHIIVLQVAAQHGEMCFPVALVTGGLRPGKAAVDGYAILHGKGRFGIVSGLTAAFIRGVQPLRHPDFARLCHLQRVLQGPQRVVPGCARLVSGRVLVHVQDTTRRAEEGLVFVGAKIHEYAHEARFAVQVGEKARGEGGVIAGVDCGGVILQAQVAVGGVHKERVGLNVAAAVCAAVAVPTAGDAAALDIAVGDLGRAAVVQNARAVGGGVAPEDGVGQRRVAVVVIHPAAIAGGIPAESDIRQRRAAAGIIHTAACIGCVVATEGGVGQRGVAAAFVEHPATFSGDVVAEGNIGERGTTSAVVHSTCPRPCMVARESDM